MVLPRKVFVCPRCEKVHHDMDSAKKCCPLDVIEQWECSECGTTFETELEAHDCCMD